MGPLKGAPPEPEALSPSALILESDVDAATRGRNPFDMDKMNKRTH